MLGAISATAGELIDSAVNDYIRTHGHRGILNIDDVAAGDPDFNAKYKDLVTDKFKKFLQLSRRCFRFSPGTIPGHKRRRQRLERPEKPYAGRARDNRADYRGSAVDRQGRGVTDADFADFVTTMVRPITAAFVQECNRKIYGKIFGA